MASPPAPSTSFRVPTEPPRRYTQGGVLMEYDPAFHQLHSASVPVPRVLSSVRGYKRYSAASQTELSFHVGDDVIEEQIFRAMQLFAQQIRLDAQMRDLKGQVHMALIEADRQAQGRERQAGAPHRDVMGEFMDKAHRHFNLTAEQIEELLRGVRRGQRRHRPLIAAANEGRRDKRRRRERSPEATQASAAGVGTGTSPAPNSGSSSGSSSSSAPGGISGRVSPVITGDSGSAGKGRSSSPIGTVD